MKSILSVITLSAALLLPHGEAIAHDRHKHKRTVKVVKVVKPVSVVYKPVVVAGHKYFVRNGIFHVAHGKAYRVVATPVGYRVAALPAGAVKVRIAGQIHYRVGSAYYLPSNGGFVSVRVRL